MTHAWLIMLHRTVKNVRQVLPQLADSNSQKDSYTKPSPYFCAGVRNLISIVPLLNSRVIV